MADRFYGIAIGGRNAKDVTESGSTTGAAIEVRINDTAYGNKMDTLLGLEAIENFITMKETTPIA